MRTKRHIEDIKRRIQPLLTKEEYSDLEEYCAMMHNPYPPSRVLLFQRKDSILEFIRWKNMWYTDKEFIQVIIRLKLNI